jgi:hypothetical protein
MGSISLWAKPSSSPLDVNKDADLPTPSVYRLKPPNPTGG